MDPVRSAAITSSLRAYQAWSLVVEHHPRGLESFALDAYIECGLYVGFNLAGSLMLRRDHKSWRLWGMGVHSPRCLTRLFDLTSQMTDDEYNALGVEANRYLQEL